MLSSGKVAKVVGADVAVEGEVEAKEETVAVPELVGDSNSVVVLSGERSKLKGIAPVHLLSQVSERQVYACILMITGAMLCIKQGYHQM